MEMNGHILSGGQQVSPFTVVSLCSVDVYRAVGLICAWSSSAVTPGLELMQNRMERIQRTDSGGGAGTPGAQKHRQQLNLV